MNEECTHVQAEEVTAAAAKKQKQAPEAGAEPADEEDEDEDDEDEDTDEDSDEESEEETSDEESSDEVTAPSPPTVPSHRAQHAAAPLVNATVSSDMLHEP